MKRCIYIYVFLAAYCVPLFLFTGNAYATNNSNYLGDNFSISPYIESQVKFWELIFDRYDRNTAIIHDERYPNVILDLIDFKKIPQAKKYRTYKSRRKLAARYKQRYNIGIKSFAQENAAAANRGKIEQRIFNAYQRNPEAFDSLISGNVKIRVQFGVASEFRTALFRAMKYLPHMEEVFANEGLPIELTRIPFVESMFNTHARSKVGAQGMWQFMEETAKEYLKINHYIDERYSPYKATLAAAKFLKGNHKLLTNWPLAITAYNHGPSSLLYATKKFKTFEIDYILKNYRARSFGFSSRNFYAEFIAVNNIFNKYRNYVLSESDKIPQKMLSVRIKTPYSLSQLAKHTPLTPEIVLKHNPGIKTKGFQYYLNHPLPENFEIFYPESLSNEVDIAMNNIKAIKL